MISDIDPCETIADAMTEFLTGSKAQWEPTLIPSINFQAIKTADPTPYLQKEKLSTLQHFVIPFGERATKIDRAGKCLEVYSVFLLIVREMDSEFPREKLSLHARKLNLAIRHNRRMGGYPFNGYDTTAKYELGVLRQVNHFASSTRFDFLGIA